MKILYVITKSNWGGAQRHVYDLATAMKQRGHDVIVALGGSGLLKTKLDAAGIFTYSIAAMGRDVSLGNDFQAMREISAIIKQKKPDIVHLHSPKAAGLGALAARLRRVPFIVQTIHGWTFNESRPLIQKLSIAFFSWLTMVLCHRTVLISEKDYGQAVYFPLIKHKITLIRPGIKPSILVSIEGAKQYVSKLVGIDTSKKTVIGTIAELHPNKGLIYLIGACAELAAANANFICVIIGDGEQKQSLQDLIHEKKLEKHVFLVGYVEQAAEYLKAFNIFALPSLKEGLPYVVLEAGYASLAVVSTPVGGLPEVIEDMRSGILIQPKNSRELAHALSFLMEHPEERRNCGVALREKVVRDFALDKMLENVEKLYTTRSTEVR